VTQDARALVRRVQAGLVAIIAGQALLLGMAAGILVAPFGGRLAGVLSGLAVAALVAWRSRAVWSLERAALWIEERDPALQYALVTAVDPRYVGWAAPSYSGPLLRRAAVRALWPALVALAVSGAVNRGAEVYGGRSFRRPDSQAGRGGTLASATFNRLVPLTVRAEPPAYTHLASRDLTEPSTVSSLVGSRIVVRGRGDTAGIRAVVKGESVRVAADGAAWTATLLMPSVASVLRLGDGSHERLVVLAPVQDAPPVVELTVPARDSVMRAARGVLPLAARASDDIGLADGHFEIIVSSGSEESGGVQGKTLAVGQMAFGDARTGTMSGGFRLDSLKPGDVVSIRAVVRDDNAVSAPGIGASETRTYRLATKEEYDSIAVEGAPPPVIDSSFLSQRMIVMATQQLLRRMAARPPMTHDSVIAVSHGLGVGEDRLASRVEALLSGEEGEPGEAMSDAERALFDTAYAAMTDASVRLLATHASAALPRALVALAALDTVRLMQRRLYLRGRPPTIIVNISRVRMTGTAAPDPGLRGSQVAGDTLRRRLVVELGAILRGPLGGPSVADSLTLMEADAMAVDPTVAGALGDAVRALQAGRDPTAALARVRRALSGPASVDTSHAAWAGGGRE
jgi:hypothetical protein